MAVVPDRGHDRRPDAQPRQPDPDVTGEATDEPLERHDVLEPDADLLRIEVGVQPPDDDRLGIGRHGQSEPASQARGTRHGHLFDGVVAHATATEAPG